MFFASVCISDFCCVVVIKDEVIIAALAAQEITALTPV